MPRATKIIPSGPAIKQARLQKNMTQADFARAADVSKRVLEKCEGGDTVTRETVARIASYLGRPVDEFLIDPKHPPMTYVYSQQQFSAEKRSVAKAVAALIEPGTSVACGSGTTVALSIQALCFDYPHKIVPIITNNLGIVDLAGQFASSIHLAPGKYEKSIHATIGDDAAQFFQETRCRIALLGGSAITQDGYLCTLHREDKVVYDSILKVAQDQVIIALDIYKLLRHDTWKVCNVKDLFLFQKKWPRKVVLVTNSPTILPTDSERNAAQETILALQKLGVDVVEAPIH